MPLAVGAGDAGPPLLTLTTPSDPPSQDVTCWVDGRRLQSDRRAKCSQVVVARKQRLKRAMGELVQPPVLDDGGYDHRSPDPPVLGLGWSVGRFRYDEPLPPVAHKKCTQKLRIIARTRLAAGLAAAVEVVCD